MTDRELLELAAKAAGIAPGPAAQDWPHPGHVIEEAQVIRWWNPLTDDGDALRLAVKLRLDIVHGEETVNVWDGCIGTGYMPNGDDPAAATRRAIVRSAASKEPQT